MEQLDTTKKTLEISEEDPSAFSAPSSSSDRSQADAGNTASDLSISRSGSFSRLNASAPEFVPRAPSPGPPAQQTGGHPRIVKIHHHPSPPPPVIHVFHPPPPPSPSVSPQFIPPGPPIGVYDYYGGTIGGGGGGGGGGGFSDHDSVQHPADSDSTLAPRDCLPEDVVQKITKQVEYYFSDLNLATTEHLMRFISKDPEGFVPISVVASFKKIKALVHNNLMLANALRTSSKLVVSDDGKRVRRVQPFTEADVEELQSRIVVAENLPEDHAYQNLMKIFSTAGSVKTIRTCYPQTSNGTAAPTNRSSKLDMLFCNKLHAFVEYETVEDAERAVAEVSKERNWRSGLRLRLLNKCMAKHVPSRGRKPGNDGDGDEEEAHVTNNYLGGDKQAPEDSSQQADSSLDPLEEGAVAAVEREGGGRRGGGKARGRGRGRGTRGQYHNNSNNSNFNSGNLHRGHAPIGTPPSSSAHPPGPRMPDGTRGFATGRGKPIIVPPPSAVATG